MEPGRVGNLPVVRWDTPGPFSAALVFRAGLRFASFRTQAVPHLVEHLVMHEVPRTHLDNNAMVDDHVMVFHATGQREEVLEFLTTVAGLVRDLPLAALDHEARVIQLEMRDSASAAGLTFLRRYGFRGVGLTGAAGPDASQVTPAQVTEFVRAHLVEENAALVTTGPLPDGFRLELPSGTRPAMPVPVGRSFDGPSILVGDHEHLALSFELPTRSPAANLAGHLLVKAVEEELRHRQGVLYDLSADRVLVSAEKSVGVLGCVPRPSDADTVAKGLVGELRRLAEDGPSDAELATARRIDGDLLGDPRHRFDFALEVAASSLEYDSAPRTPEELRAEADSVTVGDVRAVMRIALEQPLIEAPAPVEVAGFVDRSAEKWDDGPAITGEAFGRRSLSLAPLDARLVLGEDGVRLTARREHIGVAWPDVVGVEQSGNDRFLVGADGRVVPVPGAWFRDSRRLLELIDERAGELLFEVIDE